MNEDAELTLRVAEGDRQAFLSLYDRYSARVYGLALRMIRDPMTAEEITQDTFLKLWTRAETYRPARGVFIAWLLTIARRAVLDRIRVEARRPVLESSEDEDSWVNLPDPDSTSEEARWSTMRFLLNELPEDQRQTIEFAYYYGLSQSQIAEALDIPLGTVKTRVRLGMDKLRTSWMKNGDRSLDDHASKV
ncbi:MAG: sigma-70 family RNA polymerase sigma factor [Anaerolineales bacterium]|nr:MAG: sigma-70 family RNA polymerase sigma factor [Anaerolineales bacterium]